MGRHLEEKSVTLLTGGSEYFLSMVSMVVKNKQPFSTNRLSLGLFFQNAESAVGQSYQQSSGLHCLIIPMLKENP